MIFDIVTWCLPNKGRHFFYEGSVDMKKTVAKVEHKGKYRVVFDDSTRFNPYSIYKEYYEDGGWHRKKLVAYADMTSCLYHIAQEYGLYGIH